MLAMKNYRDITVRPRRISEVASDFHIGRREQPQKRGLAQEWSPDPEFRLQAIFWSLLFLPVSELAVLVTSET